MLFNITAFTIANAAVINTNIASTTTIGIVTVTYFVANISIFITADTCITITIHSCYSSQLSYSSILPLTILMII